MFDIFSDYTIRIVASGATMLGILSGVLGVFSVLRKQSLLGDAVAHSALPGIVIMFMFTFTKFSPALLLGATLAGITATGLIYMIKGFSIIPFDSALALILSSFFGLGLVLLGIVQKIPIATQAGLDKFIFGQASTMLKSDVQLLTIITVLMVTMLLLFWKEFKIFVFDPEYTGTSGFNIRVINFILAAMIVVAIIMGIQTVGVILMSSMIIAPAASARQWTDRLSVMTILAGIFGGFSGLVGAVISASTVKIPTGPVIIIMLSTIALCSILFGTKHGLVISYFRNLKRFKEASSEKLLIRLNQLHERHEGSNVGHSLYTIAPDLAIHTNISKLEKAMQKHIHTGYVERDGDDYRLTDKGKDFVNTLLGG